MRTNEATQSTKTKKAQLIAMLLSKSGATIAEISDELGWLQHTTRAALTGLRKVGFDVVLVKPDGDRMEELSSSPMDLR